MWNSVKEKPLIVITHQDAEGYDFDILVEDIVFISIPCKGGPYFCAASVSEDGGLQDVWGDDVGYSANDVSHWISIPSLP